MIIIQQAIYGEVPGKTSGHSLLAASGEKNDLFRRVSGYTDLADRPERGILSGPVVRGFFAEDHFLLIKTFPDKSPGLRSGRVFSHALFISKADLHRVHSLTDLFRYHLPAIQKEAEMHLLEYQSQKAIASKGEVLGREATATNALLRNQPFVWLSEKGYWEWIDRIWHQLPLEVKQTLKIGAAFNPSYAKNGYLNLLYIPEDVKTMWERHSFRVIDFGETDTLQSAAAHWLMGDTAEAAPFQVLVDDFAPKIESIEKLNQLQNYGKHYHQINNNPGLNHLLVLAHFVSQIIPDEKVGIKGKDRLLTAILKAIPNAPLNMFTALIYQNWKGFRDAIASASDAVREWLSNHLLQGNQAQQFGIVLVKALEAETKNWWAITRLEDRQPNDASILWQWMQNEPVLIAKHALWLPDDVEAELILKVPKLETSVAEMVLQLAEQKDWLVLHAKVAAQSYPVQKAVEAQLRLDTNQDYTLALEALSESINRSFFVPAAANHTDARLHRIAGRLIAEDRTLLEAMNITSEGWQLCWKAAIEQDGRVWSGIHNPLHTLFEILDHLLAGNTINESLLYAISTSRYGSLKDYPKRASIWSALPDKARSEFIATTLVELIDDLTTRKLSYSDLESELKKGVQSQKVQQLIINSKAIPLFKKLQLFDVVPGLRECHAKQLIQNHNFSQEEAEGFGRLLSENKWTTIVDELYNKRFLRKDLLPALLQCSPLLGFWQRLKLSASGLKLDAISTEEWWNEFSEIACKLFPNGPEQDGLWESAGGEWSQLYTSGSGRDKWRHATRLLRNNGKPKIKKLLTKMHETYPYNEELKNLQEPL